MSKLYFPENRAGIGVKYADLYNAYELSFDALNRILGESVCREALLNGLNDALAKANSYQTAKKKVVLLENDLPDNY